MAEYIARTHILNPPASPEIVVGHIINAGEWVTPENVGGEKNFKELLKRGAFKKPSPEEAEKADAIVKQQEEEAKAFEEGDDPEYIGKLRGGYERNLAEPPSIPPPEVEPPADRAARRAAEGHRQEVDEKTTQGHKRA